MDSLDDIAAMAIDGRVYDPNEIVLVGTTLDGKPTEGKIKVVSDRIDALKLSCDPKKDMPAAIAVIYAYAFEGHTYRLPKPRIMVVSGKGEPYGPATKVDPDDKGSGQLKMWRMSKLDNTVSVEVESGTLEALVLDSNTPGNRSVTSYASHMQLSHRGGKLS